ncbi:MAG: helix-turn-helix transcriptional regulator [Actinomycetota bacterium]
MPNYNFTLIIEGADLQTDEAQNALFEAGCDDATLGVVDRVQFAEFDREAGSYGQALTSAIAAIQRTIDGARVVHVEPDELVTMSEIAERLDRSRESVRLLVAGQRGPGDFPAPVSHVRTRNRLWRWPDVLRWFATRYEDEFGNRLVDTNEDPRITAMLNGLLQYRRYEKEIDEAERRELEDTLG